MAAVRVHTSQCTEDGFTSSEASLCASASSSLADASASSLAICSVARVYSYISKIASCDKPHAVTDSVFDWRVPTQTKPTTKPTTKAQIKTITRWKAENDLNRKWSKMVIASCETLTWMCVGLWRPDFTSYLLILLSSHVGRWGWMMLYLSFVGSLRHSTSGLCPCKK